MESAIYSADNLKYSAASGPGADVPKELIPKFKPFNPVYFCHCADGGSRENHGHHCRHFLHGDSQQRVQRINPD